MVKQVNQNKKRLVIITGLSGAGKSLAANTFEDMDYFCIDNIPPSQIPQIMNLWKSPSEPQNVAMVVDTRAGQFFEGLLEALNSIDNPNFDKPIILFLNANNAELVKRFKETRRRHPLVTADRGIFEAIALERQMLSELCVNADKTIDTTNLEPESMRRIIKDFFEPDTSRSRLNIAVLSFGFKHGVPLDADLVFDVRFLANPYWVPELKNLNGTNKEVHDYVLSDPLTQKLMDHLFGLVEFSMPEYIKEGKAYLTIAIGCTGGRHRSVVIAEELCKFLAKSDYTVRLEHRDLKQEKPMELSSYD